MKRMLLAGAASLALVGAAAAADLPARMPLKAPPPAPVYNWTGFYVGAYYATSIAQSRASSNRFAGDAEVNDTGISAGVTAGYNWQFAPTWLVGLEGDFGWLGTERSFIDYNDPVRVGVKTDAFGTVRGRFGYVTGPSLLYVTGGAAFSRVRETFGGSSVLAATETRSTEWGWTAGGGIETKLSRSWSTTAEYLYVDLGSNSFAANPYGLADTATFTNRAHVIKTGINYKFGDGPFEMYPLFGGPLSSPQRWAGFYVGVNAGLGISNVKVPTIMTPGPNGEENVNGTGFTGGGQAGYNWLVFSNWIVGVEGDVGYLGIDHSYRDWFDSGTEFGTKTTWYSTARGRVGMSTGPALIYGTAGAAFADVSTRWGNPSVTTSQTRSGWTVGGGIETALDSRWSVRMEYLYMDLGRTDVTTTAAFAPGVPLTAEFNNRFQVVRAGLNYSFNMPEPIVARY
ncbi:MAG: porin family protein [Rhodoplanes sp.]|uniref:outer membrane protein n=1 Tax=Rhodoplanes sp. TaxID=1968906 RepID=UPI0017B7DFE0|nr:outer membrane beta-barrel protein [Rhodoplanes sp.]NVO15649.1 porin family protein [Rhodoplanes sp.]